MCSGAILLYGIKKVVIGENINFKGSEELLMANGVELQLLNDADCIKMMEDFIHDFPSLWNEDIGVPDE
jgi:cytosine deaminase